MKGALKYIIPILLFVLFTNNEEGVGCNGLCVDGVAIECIATSSALSPIDDIYTVSPPSTSVNVPHQRNTQRRNFNGHKIYFASIRNGRKPHADNPAHTYNLQNKAYILSEPSALLIRLRKLII